MTISFLEQMKEIPDHRITGMVTYPLDEILLATLVGVLCGADDWEAIELLGLFRRPRKLKIHGHIGEVHG
jgi:hypothetical protein